MNRNQVDDHKPAMHKSASQAFPSTAQMNQINAAEFTQKQHPSIIPEEEDDENPAH